MARIPPLENREQWATLKFKIAQRLAHPAHQLTLNFAIGDDSLPRFWQRRFYDFTGAGSTFTLNASSEAWSPPEY
jgi:hypothetical protein